MSYGSAGSRYGSFRWGSATPLAGTSDRSRGEAPTSDIISAEEAYGSGLALADNAIIEQGRADYPFDLYTDERGALATVSGVRYLMQGVALKFTSAARRIIGQTWDVNTQADLELAVTQIATNDERVVNVTDVTIRQAQNRPDSFDVEMTVVAERAAHEAVFSIEGGPSTA